MMQPGQERARPEPSRGVDDRTYRLLIEQVNDHAIFIVDEVGRNVTWNEGVRRVFGFEEREWIGRPVSDLFTPEDVRAGVPEAELAEATRNGSASDDRWLVRKDGARFFAAGITSRLVDEGGCAIGFAKIIRDMTEQRRAEERARAAEAEARVAAEAAGLGYFRFFRASGAVELDARAAALYGRREGELRTLDACIAAIHEADRASVLRAIEQWRERGVPFSVEYRVVRANRESRWLLGEGSTLYDQLGEPIGLTGVVIDLTKSRRAEEALRIGEERVRLAQAAAGIGTWDWDLSAGQIVCSPEWYALRGLPVGSGTESEAAWAEYIHPDDRDGVSAALHRAYLAGGSGLALEFRVVWPDGSIHWLTARGEIHRDHRGEPVRIIGVSYDVTDQKELARRLREVQRAEAIGRLAGGVAHEVNNQMTVVLGLSDFLLADPELPVRLRRDVEDVRRAAERSARIAEQMLAYSRRQVLKPEIVALDAMIREQEPVLRRVLGPERTLELRFEEGLAPVRVDPVQIGQVLLNLVLNARDATKEGGTVTITTSSRSPEAGEHRIGPPPELPQSRSFVRVSVEDTGHGMSMETLSHVFDPFFTTKDVGKGTGLGLSTVYGVVTQHGGQVSVESELGVGTRLHVYLPVAEGEVRKREPEASRDDGASRATVLVVDDERAVLDMTARVLAEEGYDVLTASDGEEAIALLDARDVPVDLVITDIVMPRMTGTELLRVLRGRDPRLPVLTVSGFVHPEAGEPPDLKLHLEKPFSPEELRTKVREVLCAAQPRASTT